MKEYKNKIICGDCLKILKEIPNDSYDLVFTSPPYNMRTRIRNGEYTVRERSEHFSKKYKYFTDDLGIDEYYDFHKLVIKELLFVCNLVMINIQIVTGSKEAWFRLIGDFSKNIKDIIIWDKGSGQPAMHDAVINRGYEMIIILEADGMAGRTFKQSYFERGTMPDVWRDRNKDAIKEHSAVFPVSLASRAILGWTKEGDNILDPFCGTGTTCFAAQTLKRNFTGIDISPEYCKIAEERLKQKPLF